MRAVVKNDEVAEKELLAVYICRVGLLLIERCHVAQRAIRVILHFYQKMLAAHALIVGAREGYCRLLSRRLAADYVFPHLKREHHTARAKHAGSFVFFLIFRESGLVQHLRCAVVNVVGGSAVKIRGMRARLRCRRVFYNAAEFSEGVSVIAHRAFDVFILNTGSLG